ncbi:amino acid permease, partial [Hydrotalea sp.]
MKKISVYTAASIVIANMIGTGVFTSIGFQLNAIQNTWSILSLWAIGGLLSLFGAFAYAELGTHYKESGGDYIYLSRIFHPVLGYLSAWAGLTVGFSAPVALAAMAFTHYLSPVLGLSANHQSMAVGIVLLIGLLHSFTIKHSSRLQNISTLMKIGFIFILILIGWWYAAPTANALQWNNHWQKEMVQPGFAVSMVYVAFAYTGWNAAAYVVDEIENPHMSLPRALIGSTLFVTV